jgi:glutamate dehydrogenase
VLLSYAKLVLFDELVHTGLPDEPYLEPTLMSYFPAKMQKAYADDIRSHRLRREIIATILANEVINRGGPAFITMLTDGTGFGPADAVKAAVIARDGYGLSALYAGVDALDTVVAGSVQNELYEEIGRIYATVTSLLLTTGAVSGPMDQAVHKLKQALKQLRPHLSTLISEAAGDEARRKAHAYEDEGVPADLAEEIATLSMLAFVPEVMLIAGATGDTLGKTAQTFAGISSTLNIGRLLAAASRIPTSDLYEALALQRSLTDIANARRDLATVVLTRHKGDKAPLAAWQQADEKKLARVTANLSALTESGEATLAKVSVAAGVLSDLAQERAK